MLTALIISNLVLNVLLSLVCGLVAFGVLKANRQKKASLQSASYKRKK